MLTNVHVENFQSIKQADLTLGAVTLIVGPGNAGKSALVRAIGAVLTNPTGDDMIRQGAKGCRVSLTFQDPLPGTAGPDYEEETHLIWEKELGKGGTYTFQGQNFDRTAGQVPEPIAAFLNVHPIEIDKDFAVFPQVHEQFDGPFLVGESGSRVARVFGKLTKLDVLVTAQMAARREIRDATQTSNAAAVEQTKFRAQLAALPQIPEGITEEIPRLKDRLVEAQARAVVLEEAPALYRRLTQATAISGIDSEGIRADIKLTRAALAAVMPARAQALLLVETTEKLGRLDDEATKLIEALKEAGGTYAQLCAEHKVCDDCPWKG